MTDGTIETMLCAATVLLAPLLVAPSPGPDAGPTRSSGPAPASADSRSPGRVSNVVQELSREIYSPYCPGKTIAMCPSSGAAEARRKIQKMASEGKSKEAIKEDLVDQFGDEYRIEEPPPSDHIPLVVLLVAGLLACGGAIVYFARSTDGDESIADPADPEEDLDPEDRALLEEIRNEYEEPT